MEQLQSQLTSRDFSITVKPHTNDSQINIQAATLVMGDGNNVLMRGEGEARTAYDFDRQMTKQDSKESLSNDYPKNLSSNVVDGPGETIGAFCPLVDDSSETSGAHARMFDGRQVVYPVAAQSAVVGKTYVINVTIGEKYRPDHMIWRWKQNKEDAYTKCLSNSSKYNIGTVENPSLTINDVQKTDRGYYMCQAVNATGSVNSNDIFLKIYGEIPKSIIKVEENVIFGTTVILECEITSLPDVTSLTWLKNGDEIRINANATKYSGGTIHQPSLTISNVDDTDKAVYNCEVTNLVGTGTSNSVALNIIDKPTVRIDGAALVLTGRTTTISCNINVSSSAPVTKLTWLKDARKIQLASHSSKYTGGSIQTPSLTIHNIDEQDKASYSCKAKNIVGTGQSRVVQLDVAVKPVILLSASKYTVKAAGFVTLRCEIKCHPKPKRVEWYRLIGEEKTLISELLKYSGGTVNVPSLTITNIGCNDTGSYVMYAQNDFGDSWSDTVTVEGETPEIKLSTASSVLSRKSITIMCHLKSDITSLNWFKDDCALMLDCKHYIGGNLDSPHLTITAVSKLDEGRYTCKASNRFGTISSEHISFTVIFERYDGGTVEQPSLTIVNAKVNDSGVYFVEAENVAGKERSKDIQLEVKGAPPVISIPLNIEACEDQSVTLTCILKSEPHVQSLVWYKEVDGKERAIDVNGMNYHGGNLSIAELTILHADKMDTGCYMCRASNSVGTTSSGKCFLQVLYKPVVIVQLETNACDGQLVNIDCNIDAKPDIDSLQWYRIIDGQLVELLQTSKRYTGGNTRHPALSIINIGKDDEGSYICKATNSVGEGLSDECQLKVFCKPRVLIEKSAISCSTGQNISLECRIQADPAVKHIIWSKGEGYTKNRWNVLKKTENETMEGSIKPSFTIRNVQMSDSGHYVCEATNIAGTTYSEPITLDVTSEMPDSNIILLAYTTDACTVRTFKENILEVPSEKNNIHVGEFIFEEGVDKNFLDTVDRAVQSSKIVFLLLSNNFVCKAWPDVSNMSNLSDCLYSRKSLIVPVYLEQFINLPMGLRSLQCLYFYRGDNAYKKALGKLLQGSF
ncbi:titin-like isoform X2 [Mytilus californianus]|uniref:titin-like isoform X2 n=1 Tax=Mytilus californianus TaxID=6549 RepID=UPI002245009D|nr:titin-like isoform X2 [Mytilus californianus]